MAQFSTLSPTAIGDEADGGFRPAPISQPARRGGPPPGLRANSAIKQGRPNHQPTASRITPAPFRHLKASRDPRNNTGWGWPGWLLSPAAPVRHLHRVWCLGAPRGPLVARRGYTNSRGVPALGDRPKRFRNKAAPQDNSRRGQLPPSGRDSQRKETREA